MQFDLNKVSSDDILKTIRDLKTKEYDDDNALCRVELGIDYNAKKFSVRLTEHLSRSKLEDKNVQIDIYVTGESTETMATENYVEYACSYGGCELKSLQKYMNWLINAHKPEVINRLAPYISVTKIARKVSNSLDKIYYT